MPGRTALRLARFAEGDQRDARSELPECRLGSGRVAVGPQSTSGRLLFLVAFPFLLAVPKHARGGDAPVGQEFLVNTYTTSDQSFPSVAMRSDGSFMVVWHSDGSDETSEGASIQAQRFTSEGTHSGSQFEVSSYGSGLFPRVDFAGDDTFVVVWDSSDSQGGDDSYRSIQARRFSSEGVALGPQFQVNSYTTGTQLWAEIATFPDGGFVIVWNSFESEEEDPDLSVQGQRFSPAGDRVGGQFQVNSYTTGHQVGPGIDSASDGSFVVAWRSDGSDATDPDYSVQARRFGADGSPIGGQFQVNTYTTDWQNVPAVGVAPDGRFVVVWASSGSDDGDTSSTSIQMKRFSSDGAPIGDQYRVNSFTTSWQMEPSVDVGADGGFVVSWQSNAAAGDVSGYSIQARRYAPGGKPESAQFQVNSYTTSSQLHSAVEVGPGGRSVVAWNSCGSSNGDSSGTSVQGRIFRQASIFADGFESGTVSEWE